MFMSKGLPIHLIFQQMYGITILVLWIIYLPMFVILVLTDKP